MEKQKEYNLRYLLAKVCTTREKASDRLRQRANKRNKNHLLTSSDIGAELENHTVGQGPMQDRKGLTLFHCLALCQNKMAHKIIIFLYTFK
jgi:hypothetical protein